MLESVLPPRDEARQAAPGTAAARQDPAVEQVFASLHSATGVVLAVSGGPDSVALMLMVADWAACGTAPPLFVATVDHGLRPDSRREAEQVAVWAQSLGLPHRILFWEGAKPDTRIQERAREARYALLCDYAKHAGADHLVTAHHADDQAETILFRLLRGSGLRGLGGMAVATQRGELIHQRPLLEWSKDALVRLCQSRGQKFFEDPSNRDPNYARARLRRLNGVLSENGLDREALLRLGARAARADAALQERAAFLAAGLQNQAGASAFRGDISSLRGESDEILGRILEIVIGMVRSGATPLRLERLEFAAARLRTALDRHESFAATLGGVTLNLDSKTYLSIRPEAQRRRGRKQEG